MCLNRLATSPAIVLTSKYGWSANMERIMKAQALSDGQQQSYMKGMKTLEVNPHHPLIQQLKAQACPLPHLPPAQGTCHVPPLWKNASSSICHLPGQPIS